MIWNEFTVRLIESNVFGSFEEKSEGEERNCEVTDERNEKGKEARKRKFEGKESEQ